MHITWHHRGWFTVYAKTCTKQRHAHTHTHTLSLSLSHCNCKGEGRFWMEENLGRVIQVHSFCVQFASTECVFTSEIKIATPKQELNLPRKSTMFMQNLYNYICPFSSFFCFCFVLLRCRQKGLVYYWKKTEWKTKAHFTWEVDQNKNLTSDDLVLSLPWLEMFKYLIFNRKMLPWSLWSHSLRKPQPLKVSSTDKNWCVNGNIFACGCCPFSTTINE